MARIKLLVREVAEKKGVSNPFLLSKQTGLNYATCHKLWDDKHPPRRIDLQTLARLCEVLSVKPGQLLEYQSDKGRS
jgi:DNA-binding Xre family transcriptional regulator